MMVSIIPRGAMHLLDFIGSKEAPQGFGTVFGNKQARLNKPLVQWTVAEIVSANPTFTKRFGSSACGRYQFMRDTLKGLIAENPQIANQLFTPDLQNVLGYRLLQRRGYDKFAAGKLTVPAFGKALAQEWASFPVLADTKGAHRDVKRGETYYLGDGVNQVLATPAEVERVLRECRGLKASLVAAATLSEPASDATMPVGSPDPGAQPVLASQADPSLVAPAGPLTGLLRLFQGKPPVPKGTGKAVVAETKAEVPSLMKDLGDVRLLGILGAGGSVLGGFQDSGLLDTVKSTADTATSTFESVQSLINLVLGAIKWGVTHWWVFGLVLSIYVLVRIGWAIFKVYVYVRNNLKPQ